MAVSASFKAWCLAGGMTFDGIDAAFVADGWRGVIATKDIAPGHVILSVPERLLLSRRSANRDPQLCATLARCAALKMTSQQVLALHLLHEVSRGPSSFWWPYLETLPRVYTTLSCFSEQDAAELQLAGAISTARDAAGAAHRDWCLVQPAMQDLGLPKKLRSLKAWSWATATLLTRTMFMPDDAAGALTPFGDLHNYQPPPPLDAPDVLAGHGTSLVSLMASTPAECWQDLQCGDGSFDEASQQYKLYTRRRYHANEQVYLCYGRHTNLELLEYYGFLLPHNPHDTAMLSLQLLQPQLMAVAPHPAAVAGISASALLLRSTDCWVHVDGRPSWALLQWLRSSVASAAERKQHSHAIAEGKRISVPGDVAAMALLRCACEQQLAALPTTAQQDEVLLQQLLDGSSRLPVDGSRTVTAGEAETEGLSAVSSQLPAADGVAQQLQDCSLPAGEDEVGSVAAPAVPSHDWEPAGSETGASSQLCLRAEALSGSCPHAAACAFNSTPGRLAHVDVQPTNPVGDTAACRALAVEWRLCHKRLKTVDQYYFGARQDIQVAGVKLILDSIFTSLQRNPDRKFSYAEMSFFSKWWEEQDDTTRDAVRALVAQGRLDFVNGGYVQHDEATAHYVAMVDQTTRGHRFLNASLGVHPRVGWQLDPFGHSSTHASLMSGLLGFDALVFGRADYQDLALRSKRRDLEFLWRASPSFGTCADVWTHNYPTGNYNPPTSFNYEYAVVTSSPAIVDDPASPEYNILERVDTFVAAAHEWGGVMRGGGGGSSTGGTGGRGAGGTQGLKDHSSTSDGSGPDTNRDVGGSAGTDRSSDVMFLMGTDFTYANAESWFSNLDKLIHHVNLNGRVNVMYSTPAAYADARRASPFAEPRLSSTTSSSEATSLSTDMRTSATGGGSSSATSLTSDTDPAQTNIQSSTFTSTSSSSSSANLAEAAVSKSSSSTSAAAGWYVKRDDFFPYADGPHCYWTGYFTSRPTSKAYIRRMTSYLQVARQLQVIMMTTAPARLPDGQDSDARHQGGTVDGADGDVAPATELHAGAWRDSEWDSALDDLEAAVSLTQHHDAVTGTEKQAVANDYARRLYQGWLKASALVNTALQLLLHGAGCGPPGSAGGSADKPATSTTQRHAAAGSSRRAAAGGGVGGAARSSTGVVDMVQCPLLNASVCGATVRPGPGFLVVAYNSLARPRTEWVRIPVGAPGDTANTTWHVMDADGNAVPSAVQPVSESTSRLQRAMAEAELLPAEPDGSSGEAAAGRFDLLFHLDLPAMGYTTYAVYAAPAQAAQHASSYGGEAAASSAASAQQDAAAAAGGTAQAGLAGAAGGSLQQRRQAVVLRSSSASRLRSRGGQAATPFEQLITVSTNDATDQNHSRSSAAPASGATGAAASLGGSCVLSPGLAGDDTVVCGSGPLLMELDSASLSPQQAGRNTGTSGTVSSGMQPGGSSRTGPVLRSLAAADRSYRLSIRTEIMAYLSSNGDEAERPGQASGAYIFRPASNAPHAVPLGPPTNTLYTSELLTEVHQDWGWASLAMRLYRLAEYLELEWTVGPIPVDDGIGKEVVLRIKTDLQTDGRIWTDSNGREMLQRRRDARPTWPLDVNERAAGNYYPMTSGAKISDGSLEVSVATGCAQAVASLVDGELEIMLHRRTLSDDARGVGEPLNETMCGCRYCQCAGLIARGVLRLTIAQAGNIAADFVPRDSQLFLNDPPVLTFAPLVQIDREQVGRPVQGPRGHVQEAGKEISSQRQALGVQPGNLFEGGQQQQQRQQLLQGTSADSPAQQFALANLRALRQPSFSVLKSGSDAEAVEPSQAPWSVPRLRVALSVDSTVRLAAAELGGAAANSLPMNVHLVTMLRLSPNRMLIRLAHMYGVEEHRLLSKRALVNLSSLLQCSIVAVRELTLSGGQYKDEFLEKRTESGLLEGRYEHVRCQMGRGRDGSAVSGNSTLWHHDGDAFPVVELLSMEIRTFEVAVQI